VSVPARLFLYWKSQKTIVHYKIYYSTTWRSYNLPYYLCVIIGGIHCYGNKRLCRWSVIPYSLQTSAGSSPGSDVARAIIYRNRRSMRNNDLRIEKLDTAQYSVCVCLYFYGVPIIFYDVITHNYDVCIYTSAENTHLHLGNSV